jgi:quercetin dioxygenase-like cupin family protein
MSDRFEDQRGVIEDILDLGGVDLNGVVTEIVTYKGAVRGNHVHAETDQWVYVVSGRMLTATANVDFDKFPVGSIGEEVRRQGELFMEPRGVPHAWKALDDTVVLVFTKGPRSGQDYARDTQHLPEEQWLLRP